MPSIANNSNKRGCRTGNAAGQSTRRHHVHSRKRGIRAHRAVGQRKSPAATDGAAAPQPNDRKRQIQEQLMLLLHAHKCNRRENREVCNVNHCKAMKTVLAHMVTCKQSKDCTMQHCAPSRQILLHYKTCINRDCIICFPFRQKHVACQNANVPPGGGPAGNVETAAFGGGAAEAGGNLQQQQQHQQQPGTSQQQQQLQEVGLVGAGVVANAGVVAGDPAVAGGGAGQVVGPGGANREENDDRARQIKQQLMLILHAHKCREDCNVNHCMAMKALLAHMGVCKQSKDCTMQHCVSSRQILLHYKTCINRGCIICSPVRQIHAACQNSNVPPRVGPAGNAETATIGSGATEAVGNVQQQQQHQQQPGTSQQQQQLQGVGLVGAGVVANSGAVGPGGANRDVLDDKERQIQQQLMLLSLEPNL